MFISVFQYRVTYKQRFEIWGLSVKQLNNVKEWRNQSGFDCVSMVVLTSWWIRFDAVLFLGYINISPNIFIFSSFSLSPAETFELCCHRFNIFLVAASRRVLPENKPLKKQVSATQQRRFPFFFPLFSYVFENVDNSSWNLVVVNRTSFITELLTRIAYIWHLNFI